MLLHFLRLAEFIGSTRQKPSLLTAWRDAWDEALWPVGGLSRVVGFRLPPSGMHVLFQQHELLGGHEVTRFHSD